MLSMYDPIHVGSDEFGQPVLHPPHLQEPARRGRTRRRQIRAAEHRGRPRRPVRPARLVLFDGKDVELGMWDEIADEFVGPDIGHAIITLLPAAEGDGQPVRLAAAPTAAARSNPATA